MKFESSYFGPQHVTDADRQYAGSRFSEVKSALFENAYYLTWGAYEEPPLPVYAVTLGRVLKGILPWGREWRFQQASRRAIDAQSDMRWGPDGRGFRRLLHPNGVCLTGTWEIDSPPEGTGYSGYFREGSQALIVGRYSSCCTETRRGRYRSLSLVGKLYPTTDPDHVQPLRTANFITQEDLGGEKTRYINDAEVRNAPDVTPWRRGLGAPILLLTGLVFRRTDAEPAFRQLYQIAELGNPDEEPTRAPRFMRLTVVPEQSYVIGDNIDFRDEVLTHIYDKGDPEPKRTLSFNIEVSDEGTTKGRLVQRRIIKNWKRIGRITFDDAVASYNGDFVIHFHHPPWRNDRNAPSSLARPQGAR